jgi:hypothetical protein
MLIGMFFFSLFLFFFSNETRRDERDSWLDLFSCFLHTFLNGFLFFGCRKGEVAAVAAVAAAITEEEEEG